MSLCGYTSACTSPHGRLCSLQHLAVRNSPQGVLIRSYGRDSWRVSSSELNCRIEDHVRFRSDHSLSCRPGRACLFTLYRQCKGGVPVCRTLTNTGCFGWGFSFVIFPPRRSVLLESSRNEQRGKGSVTAFARGSPAQCSLASPEGCALGREAAVAL